MSERKIIRHNVFITNTMAAGANFTVNIFCPFTPDEVKVKQIAYCSAAAENTTYSLHCHSLTGSSTMALGSFIEPCASFTGTTFPLGRSIAGTHTFRVQVNNAPTTTAAGQLNVLLEFRKYL